MVGVRLAVFAADFPAKFLVVLAACFTGDAALWLAVIIKSFCRTPHHQQQEELNIKETPTL